MTELAAFAVPPTAFSLAQLSMVATRLRRSTFELIQASRRAQRPIDPPLPARPAVPDPRQHGPVEPLRSLLLEPAAL